MVSTVTSQQRFPGSIPSCGLSVWSCMVSLCMRGFSPGTPASASDLKLSVRVSVSVNACVSRLSLCVPVMDWRPVQGEPRLSPDDRWDRFVFHKENRKILYSSPSGGNSIYLAIKPGIFSCEKERRKRYPCFLIPGKKNT